ncbi:1,2-phenylacetyl-CoA epoxidase subunit PaaC [Ottowia sp.]|uniref:1,2-phenylacetyl-CoA epoxidase subunit PaaC n=1 Tax=Ottowia sp. TaxID=1898956 RepID=UPI0026279164|nr:1,2-phenylacetyl-CoA epoxidase subunit PaaC [Ottowia sp.]
MAAVIDRVSAPIAYLLHLADNALVLGQRNAEWCGHAPTIEEDMSMANNSLDLIGQARLLYQYVAERMNAEGRTTRPSAWPAGPITEDTLAYFRDVPDFLNYTLLELPHSPALVPMGVGNRDWATTIVRNWLYSQLMVMVWERLQACGDERLAAIAAKSLKEVRYHLRHSRDWLVRLGDGTDESHRRMQDAVDHLLPYTSEFWAASPTEAGAIAAGCGVDVPALLAEWDAVVDAALQEATLRRPPEAKHYVTEGKRGVHSEHLGYLLNELQGLARQHPGAVW